MELTGLEMIVKERIEMIEKHGFTVQYDVDENSMGELLEAIPVYLDNIYPCYEEWPWRGDKEFFNKIHKKKWIERLAIAGALLAAEIDRLKNT
jgi:hypothetical protein